MELDNRLISQRFLNNLDRIGCWVRSYAHYDRMISLTFDDIDSAATFTSFLKLLGKECWYMWETFDESEAIRVEFADSFLKKAKRLAVESAKNPELELPEITRDEIMGLLNPFEKDVEDCLNQLREMYWDGGNIEAMDDCCNQELAASISPDSREDFNVLLELIPRLLPRELGGVTLYFKNTPLTLTVDLEHEECDCEGEDDQK